MKNYILFLLLAITGTCSAQEKSKYDSLMAMSQNNRAVGIVCAVGGPVLIITGMTLVGVELSKPNIESSKHAVNLALGAVTIIGGTIITCIAPVCCIKARHQKEAAQGYKPAVYLYPPSPAINYAQGASAVGLSLHLRF